MKPIKQIIPKEAIKETQRLSSALDRFADAIGNTFRDSSYFRWYIDFKPQSQSIIWIVPLIGLLFGIGVIIWYLLFIGI